jgi:hypothetical protein
MSCRKVCRELLERIRFGDELDLRSAPHLAHLEHCLACREEIGLNRTIVRQLQRALRARVEAHEPSERAWQIVSARALAEDDSFGARMGRVFAALRRPASIGNAVRVSAPALALALAVFVGAGAELVGHDTSQATSAARHPRAFVETAWVDPSGAPRRHGAFDPPFPSPPQAGILPFAGSTEVPPQPPSNPVRAGLQPD